MSETKFYTGVIKKLNLEGSFSEKMTQLIKLGLHVDLDFSDEEDEVLDSNEVEIINGDWYQVVSKSENLEEDDVFEAEQREDGIHYAVKYYNGGCGFGEALETAINDMEAVEIPENIFEIDFGGNVLAQIVIKNNVPEVVKAIDGRGTPIYSDKIKIKTDK